MAKPKTAPKPINFKKLEPHRLGGIFPALGDHDYQILCDSIKLHGFNPKKAIVLYEGKILDGNNRYTASKKVRKEPEFREFNPDKEGMSAFDFVLQENLARRNLTPSQASAVAAELASTWEELEAAANPQDDVSSPNSDSKSKGKKARSKGDKTTKAAKALGVSRASVAAAKKLGKENPDALKDVAAGKTTLNAATTEAKKKKTKEEVASDEFAVHQLLVEKVCGEAEAKKLVALLPTKDFIKYSGLDEDEMTRILPYLLASWSLKQAMGWKSVELTYTHKISDLIARTIGNGGKYTLDLHDCVIEVKMKKVAAVSPDAE